MCVWVENEVCVGGCGCGWVEIEECVDGEGERCEGGDG